MRLFFIYNSEQGRFSNLKTEAYAPYLYGVARPGTPLRLQRIAIPASRLGLPSWMRIVRIRALRERIPPELPSAHLGRPVSPRYVRSSETAGEAPRAL